MEDTVNDSSDLTGLDTEDEEVLEEKRSLGSKRKRKRAMRREMGRMSQFHTMTWSTA
jgi:hypothetical protein